MNSDLCQELIQHFDDGSLKCGHAPRKIEEWFETLGLQMDLLRFMQWNWPQKSGYIGHLCLFTSQEIHDNEDTTRLLAFQFLTVGNALNGDLLVLDFSTDACVPGFISHDELWENDDVSPREIFQPIARTFESLLYRISEGRYVPTDYYAACAFNKFLDEERNAKL